MPAYKIVTTIDEKNGFGIYISPNAGRAKTRAVFAMRDSYSKATYSWIKFCRRAPEFDYLESRGSGCVAWTDGHENWQIDRGHWWDGVPVSPVPPDDQVPTCRICGCTENNACMGGCYWVQPDLCSSCEEVAGLIRTIT